MKAWEGRLDRQAGRHRENIDNLHALRTGYRLNEASKSSRSFEEMHILKSSGCFTSCPRHGGRDREEIKRKKRAGHKFYVMEYPLTVHKHGGKRRRRGTGAGVQGAPWVSVC